MKVFLSSTYKDLIEHRKFAAEAIERLGLQGARMEVFGARPEEPLHACLKEIQACNLFIGIYAHRYGFIPEGSDLSITELEYRHAQNLKKPLFCFVVDEHHPWPPKLIEENPSKQKLEMFKQTLGSATIRETFSTPEDLAYKIASSLGHYLSREASRESALDIDQVAAVCYRDIADKVEFLLIKTSGRRWIFPKGKLDEEDNEEWAAAEREAFEESGAMGRIEHERMTVVDDG
jgi:8-oxo-dGTP pyrophosphatase MutT (NUDIX family)